MNAFHWRGQPSEIIAANPSMQAKVTTGYAMGKNGKLRKSRAVKTSEVLRDNNNNPFCAELAPPFDAAGKTCRILKGPLGSQT